MATAKKKAPARKAPAKKVIAKKAPVASKPMTASKSVMTKSVSAPVQVSKPSSKVMKINVSAFALALGILGSFSMFMVTIYPEVSSVIFDQNFGIELRAFMMDVYPYYSYATWHGVALGLVYGFLDGFIFGALLGFLYNAVAEN